MASSFHLTSKACRNIHMVSDGESVGEKKAAGFCWICCNASGSAYIHVKGKVSISPSDPLSTCALAMSTMIFVAVCIAAVEASFLGCSRAMSRCVKTVLCNASMALQTTLSLVLTFISQATLDLRILCSTKILHVWIFLP